MLSIYLFILVFTVDDYFTWSKLGPRYYVPSETHTASRAQAQKHTPCAHTLHTHLGLGPYYALRKF